RKKKSFTHNLIWLYRGVIVLRSSGLNGGLITGDGTETIFDGAFRSGGSDGGCKNEFMNDDCGSGFNESSGAGD
ncbi:hypothetical protein L195_g046960, partial [Trifolium pratense]